jgi:phospholipid-transporting ATPase
MIFDSEKNLPARVQSSNLNEELGMVNYIFSDKTGTLTQNIMEFKMFSAGFTSYGSSNPLPVKYEPGVTNVNFMCSNFDRDWTESIKLTGKPDNPYLQDFIKILALAHTIIPEKKNDILFYNASSPDELALTNAARHFGMTFTDRDEDNNMVIKDKNLNKTMHYQLLNVIEFTSARKRMSVIVKSPEDKILIMTKGADSHIIPRLAPGQDKLIEATNNFLQDYSKDGLRTLRLAQREVPHDEYEQWSRKFA